MARITIEDCLQKIPSRFKVALIAALYTRHHLVRGQLTQEGPEIKSKNKPPVRALRAIAAGKVGDEMLEKIPT